MTPQEVAPLIRGPVGSRIELDLLRDGERQIRTVVITRQKIEQSGPVSSEAGKGGVRQAIGEFFRPAGAAAGGASQAAASGSKSLQISAPFNFQHRVHVQVWPGLGPPLAARAERCAALDAALPRCAWRPAHRVSMRRS